MHAQHVEPQIRGLGMPCDLAVDRSAGYMSRADAFWMTQHEAQTLQQVSQAHMTSTTQLQQKLALKEHDHRAVHNMAY